MKFGHWGLCVLLASVIGCSGAKSSDLDHLVKGLDADSANGDFAALDVYGCQAVPALVKELGVVEIDRLYAQDEPKNPRAAHIASTVMALRYITGTDFYADMSDADLTELRPDNADARMQMMTMGAPPHKVKFLSVWLSRGTLYFPSPTQQREIIAQWQAFAAAGKCPDRSLAGRTKMAFYLAGVK